MELRNYQEKLVNGVENHLQSSNSVLMQLSTGGGKSPTVGQIVKNMTQQGGRVIILAHREEIISQLHKTLLKFGLCSGIIMPKYDTALSLPIQIGGVRTYINRPTWEADLLVFDEAHHASATTYRQIRDRHKDAKFLGVTATPYRLNGKGLNDMFKGIVTGPTTLQLEQWKYLSPANTYINPLDSAVLSKVGKVAGDYNEANLAKLMGEEEIVSDVIESYCNYAFGKRAIVFAVNVAHSKTLAQKFCEAGIRAVHLDAKSDNRAATIRLFEAGQIKVLCNVGIATEGTDIPGIECVILARPTKSLSLYLQMVGRGSRIILGKSNYILLDCANCVLEHGLPNEEHDWVSHFYGTYKKSLAQAEKREEFVKVLFDNQEQIVAKKELDNFPQGIKGLQMQRIEGDFRVLLFNDCLKFATKKKYSKGSAYYEFCNRLRQQNSKPSFNELQVIAKKLNYTNAWIYHELNAWK